jgi:predicted metal-dependent phosphoesterase TrpH
MENKLIDLHTHTLFSDGRESLNNLLKLASERNIEILSITDHDSVYAYDSIQPTSPIKIITGVELSVWYNDSIIHILGYGFDFKNKKIREYCDDIFLTSLERTKDYLKVLNKHNIFIPESIIKEHVDNRYPLQYERLFSILYKLNILLSGIHLAFYSIFHF